MKKVKYLALLILLSAFLFSLTNAQWIGNWGNNGNGSIGGWNLRSDDVVLPGSFYSGGDYNDDLLTINRGTETYSDQGLFYDGQNYYWDFLFGGQSSMGGWQLHSNDSYYLLRSKSNQSYLLATNPNGYAATLIEQQNQFSGVWGNSGNNKINNWSMNSDDVRVTGYFDGTDRAGLLSLNVRTHYINLQVPSGSSWQDLYWSSSGSMAGWAINGNDIYIAGDFDGDGSDELLCRCTSTGWMETLHYASGSWSSQWSNSGNGTFGSWTLTSTDRIVVGKFLPGRNDAQVLMVNPNSHFASLYEYVSGSWVLRWSNNGNGTICGWTISSSDSYAKFYSQGQSELLAYIPYGWASLLELNSPIYVPKNYSTIAAALSSAVIGQTVSVSSGSYNITSTLTVPAGITLSFSAGTTVQFSSGASLIANGVLNVAGTSSQPVTFTSTGGTSPGSWGSVQMSQSGASSSNINYANILYGTEVDVSSANNVTIQNCSITNNSGNGIYINSSSNFTALHDTIKNTNAYHGIYISGGSSNNCYYNVISKTNQSQNGAGILYSGASGTVGENDIDYYNWGIAAIWGASPNADHSPATKNNRVTHCQLGLNVYYQSYCNFGQYTYAYTWNLNSIHDNSPYNAAVGYSYPTVASGLYAEDDWWNNASLFYVSSACYGYFTPTHSSDPWYGYPIPSNKRMEDGVVVTPSIAQNNNRSTPFGSIQNTVISPSIPADSLFIGVGLRDQKKFKDAKDLFMSYLNAHPDNQAAYVHLYSCADTGTTSEIIQYFKNLPKQADYSHKLLLANLYLTQGDINSAKQVNNAIIAANPNTPLALRAKLNNFSIALDFEHDANTASAILTQVEAQASLSTPMELLTAEGALKFYVDPKTGQMPNINAYQSGNATISPLALNDGLLQNYPNPFNPATVIAYRVTQAGRVSLKIYDVLGREVADLVNGDRESGVYTERFDASHLSSGIYFYRLIAPGIDQTRKMLVTK